MARCAAPASWRSCAIFSFEDAFRHKIASITAKVLAEFRAWLAMTPEARASRELICFRGMDNRTVER